MSEKTKKAPSTVLFPVPVVLVTCENGNLKPNIITIAWTGTVNSSPPMVSISLTPQRYSYQLIKESGEYVVNIPSAGILKEVDFCGINSGSELDKFEATGLTPVPAEIVKAPLIKECPVNIECRVRQELELGSHHMFLGEVVAVHVNEDVLNDKGRVDVGLAKAVSYCSGEYWLVEQMLGKHGFSRTR